MTRRSLQGQRKAAATLDQLLLREAVHRFGNDLQMIVGLIAIESRRAASQEVKEALQNVGDRIALFARKRTGLGLDEGQSLSQALRDCCQTLMVQAETRSVLISFRMNGDDPVLGPDTVRAVALAVNELVTNALQHAFEERTGGRIWVNYQIEKNGAFVISVDDDGNQMAEPSDDHSHMGLSFISKLIAGIGGEMTLPRQGAKEFIITLPKTVQYTRKLGNDHGGRQQHLGI